MTWDRSSILNVVHGIDGPLGILLVGVSHKAKPAAAAGVPVLNNHLQKFSRLARNRDGSWLEILTHGFFHNPELFELLAEDDLLRVPCKASELNVSKYGFPLKIGPSWPRTWGLTR